MRWRLRLTEPARTDIDTAIIWSRETFGTAQARRYSLALRATIMALRRDPLGPGSRARDEVQPGLRSFSMPAAGQRGRHVLIYRADGDGRIIVLRLLHDAMDPARHLP